MPASGRGPRRARCSSSRATTGGTTSSASPRSTARSARSSSPATAPTRSGPATATTSATCSRNSMRRASGIWTGRRGRSTSGRPRRCQARRRVCADAAHDPRLGPGTAHVTFRGFDFECCEGTAIMLRNTTDCLVAGCTIRNVGDYTARASRSTAARQRRGRLRHLTTSAATASRSAAATGSTLTPAGNYADNNYIHHIGRLLQAGRGVSLSGVGNRASHNLIHDGPRWASCSAATTWSSSTTTSAT